MYLLRHANVATMIIVDGDVNKITTSIWNTSNSIDRHQPRYFLCEEINSCDLDPGGLLCWKIPRIQIFIDEYNFDIQLSRIGEMIQILEKAEERIPGYIRFLTFHGFVILSKYLFGRLFKKLKELELTDAALSAELQEIDIKDGLYHKSK